MRITNKIMQNNSLYNINNNKVSEDQLNTMMATGKKLTRPSDDPVVAIRALRLRSSVTQLKQYYEKNAKDADSWLKVTGDALSTITSVLTDSVKQANKGSNKELTLDDLDIIVTQMDALAKEYYATGNVDYAGRYVFTGYRTDRSLSYDKTTTATYTDINDEFNAKNITDSHRVCGKYKIDSSTVLDDTSQTIYEHDISEKTVGRLRLSYDNLDYIDGDNKEFQLKFREDLVQPATSTVVESTDVINLTYITKAGTSKSVMLPAAAPTDSGTPGTNADSYEITSEGITYKVETTRDAQDVCTYKITATDENGTDIGIFNLSGEGVFQDDETGNVSSAITSKETKKIATITYTDDAGQKSVKVPLLPAVRQSYTIKLSAQDDNGNDLSGFEATVNSDGTFTIKDTNAVANADGTEANSIIQVTSNGSVHASYKENTLTVDSASILYSTTKEEDIDAAYEALSVDTSDNAKVYLNASTGELLLNDYLKKKLSTLPDIINANSIDVIYDKKEWVEGDIRPENLFSCTYWDENNKSILYNKGTAPHEIAYDVGFSQSVVVNTTAEEVFTTNVKRDVSDLSRILNELKQVNNTIKTLEQRLKETTEKNKQKKIQAEIDAANKAYSYLRDEIQKEFEHKITSTQKSLDTANIAVTSNGTRAKRLELVDSRLMEQTTTFEALKSDNEDIDLAEAVTKLTTAQVIYEASLMATGKISQSSLMNYI
ncbi:flagellin N-terminal helical domain-containing protein [Butyrivibrio sp. YAB3001]|uniref:flagellin N-terminal helical domain-containing protein n=1 Tax=Butyrivibrio sp. YAB3001 TaxID=1520812 RepID=UPI0008F68E03|nr:flagellin [Butyrivibrio sp. YAB3001]SFB95586.1 flagellar hook-associated protein 3 FlgL [Butyrivibrio sp. YAB3001]